MAKSSSASSAGRILANRYAVALIDVAHKANALQAIEKNIISLENILNTHPELQGVMSHPVFSSVDQLAVLRDLGVRHEYHKLTLNFFGVLAENRRLNALGDIISAFKAEIAVRAGVVEAKVLAAQKLTAIQEESLSRNLSAKIGKNVKLNISIDPSLLGGLVITIGSTMVDDSVRSKLSRLQQAMTQSKAA